MISCYKPDLGELIGIKIVYIEDKEAINGNIYNITRENNALIYVSFTSSYMDYRGIFASSGYGNGRTYNILNELKFEQAGNVGFTLSYDRDMLKGTIKTPKSCSLFIKVLTF